METETKKIDTKKVVITLLLVLLTAGAVGGGIYYVLNKNIEKEREANEKALKDLQDQIAKVNEGDKELSTSAPEDTPAIRSFGSGMLADAINSYLQTNSAARISKVYTDTGSGDAITNVVYADLDSNKNEYALVTVTASGSGGIKVLYILTLKNNQLTVVSNVDAQGLGHNSFNINGTTLTQTYPIYKDGDPNCCPTGGNAVDTYKWDGKNFVKQ